MCKVLEEMCNEAHNEGRIEGYHEKAVEIAVNMINMKIMSLKQIAEITRLPLAEVQTLANA